MCGMIEGIYFGPIEREQTLPKSEHVGVSAFQNIGVSWKMNL